MIKLYYAPGTCALAPHIVLEWIGIEFEIEKVVPGSDEFKQINPAGSVPAMSDGHSAIMTQSDAILKYLADKHPDADLGPSNDLKSRYEMDRWLAYLTGDLHPAFFPIFMPQRFTSQPDDNSIEEIKLAAYRRISDVLAVLETHVNGPYLLEGRRTVADAYAFAMIRWVNVLPKPLSRYPNLNRFHDLFIQDSAVRRVLCIHGIQF